MRWGRTAGLTVLDFATFANAAYGKEAGDSKATAVVIAAASGTFIYVALVEVAIPELDRPGNPLEKVACVVSGYFLMGVLAIWV